MKYWWILLASVLLAGCASVSIEATAPALIESPANRHNIFSEVQPTEGSEVRLSVPSDWSFSPSYPTSPDDDRIGGDVCADFSVGGLLEAGDDLHRIDNAELKLDGEVVDHSLLGHETLDTEICITHTEPQGCGPQRDTLCWMNILEPGLHIAEVRVWSTSGIKEYSYTWAFEVAE